MIGLDTNILVRLLVADDVPQADAARKFVRERCTAEAPGFVNLVVLCELVWTLDRTYGLSQSDIARAIDFILSNSIFRVESHDRVASALQRFRGKGTDFPDALVAEINRSHGCDATATFDRKAARLDGFMLVR
jgi:predicted nucleic-acid-binding protein